MQTVLRQSAARLLASRCQRSWFSTSTRRCQQAEATTPLTSFASKALLWGAAFVGAAITLSPAVYLDTAEEKKDDDTRSPYNNLEPSSFL